MIDGKWQLVSGEKDGQTISAEELQRSALEVAGGRHKVQLGDDLLGGTHTLNTNQNPMTIDAYDTIGPLAGQTTLGIFNVEGDLFTVCFAAPGQGRPSEFTTQDGQASILHVWKRQAN